MKFIVFAVFFCVAIAFAQASIAIGAVDLLENVSSIPISLIVELISSVPVVGIILGIPLRILTSLGGDVIDLVLKFLVSPLTIFGL